MSVEDIVDGMGKYLEGSGEANYIALIEGMGTTGKIAGAIIHALIVLIIFLTPIVVAIEVCYINFPVFQEKCDQLYNRLEGNTHLLGLTIRDARAAVELSQTTEYGASANWIYLKRKCKAIFICVFIIALELGPGQFVIKFLFDFAKKFIDIIRSFL